MLLTAVCIHPVVSQQLLSEVSLNKSPVYVGEPVEVTITVYTSTWFTRGIDPGNIKVDGAFTTFFRPVSTSIRKDGQTYAGVQLIYNVFPYSEKDILFPSLEITVETPPEGDFKGVSHVITSDEKRIRVTPVPAGFDRDEWLVTTGLGISDQWQGDLQQVKVGDVLVRRITRTAESTVSELIPPVIWDSIPDVSMYKARSSVQNNRTTTSISAVRSDAMRYLFEKEGEVTLPAMTFSWYDPSRKQLFKRTLEEITIRVRPNPDLGVLASVRDSLQAEQASMMDEEGVDNVKTILGLSPGRFVVFCLLAVVLAVAMFLLTRRFIRWMKKRRRRFRNSEAYYFREYTIAVRKKDAGEALRLLYRWVDMLHLSEPSIGYFTGRYGNRRLQEAIWKPGHGRLSHEALSGGYLKDWKAARINYKRGIVNTGVGDQFEWINPVHPGTT